jgi:hypothetical protein
MENCDTVVEVAPHGAVTIQNDEGETFKVNGQHLKVFLEPGRREYEIIKFTKEL